MCTGRRFEPVSIPGSSKFGARSSMSKHMFDSMDLPAEVKRDLANMCGHSKANAIWSTYRTAERLTLMCQKEHKVRWELPFSSANMCLFVHWLFTVRRLKVATVNSYLAGVRQMHISMGMEPPNLRDSFVKEILRGKSNMESFKQKGPGGNHGRLPMTISLMKLWKEKIRLSNLNPDKKLLIWAVSTLAFYGAFRIHELVSKTEATFDPDHTLLTEDIRLAGTGNERWLEISLKCPKEKKSGRPTIIDVFEVGGQLCPVSAFLKWSRHNMLERGMPIFRDSTGTPLTGREVNKQLKSLLGKFAVYKNGSISSHSFRSGIVSILGSKGFSDEEIKLVGRWSSRAFIRYMKLPRTQRAAIAKRIGHL